MEKSEIKTRLVEENNTIYEIDLDCLKRKEQRKKERGTCIYDDDPRI